MITLTGFTQTTSQLASETGSENPLIPVAENEAGISNLAAFDNVLSQAWEPHQPISLRPSVVMDLITQEIGKDADKVSLTDEHNLSLLDALLQTHAQNVQVPSPPSLPTAAFSPRVPHGDNHLAAELVPSEPLEESSPLLGLLKSIGPRLDINSAAVTVGENIFSGRIVPEGQSTFIPSMTSGNIANNHHETVAPHMESQLTLVKAQPDWSQQLRTVLGERLQLQVESKVQHATIRLDPPDMGKIDISVHMEGGKLQVHINASQGDVYRALQQSSAELRQTLTGQNSAAVEVQISANSQQQQRQQQHQKPHDDILAARHIETQTDMGTDDGTLLITV